MTKARTARKIVSAKIFVGTDSLCQQLAEEPSVESDPARAGPTPE
jgi:hypothetical protein